MMRKIFFLASFIVILLGIGIMIKVSLPHVFAQQSTPTSGSISGYVFYDKNENGIQDNGEGQTFENGEAIGAYLKLNGGGNFRINPDGTFEINGLSLMNSTETAPINYQVEVVSKFDDQGHNVILPTTAVSEYVTLPPSAPTATIKFGVTHPTKTLPPGTCQLTAIPEHHKFPRIGDNLLVLVRSNALAGQSVSFVEDSPYNSNTIPGLLSATTVTVVWTDFAIAPGRYGTLNVSGGSGSVSCVMKRNNKVDYSQKIDVQATLVSWEAFHSPVISWTVNSNPVVTSNYTETPVTPTSAAAGCALSGKGDVNCDGKIDLLDFNIWRTNFLTQP